MPDEKIADTKTADKKIVEQIALETPGGFEITTDGASVTGKHLYADGGDGQEKEATIRNRISGASSAAPASSGIPSAMTQQSVHSGTHVTEVTAPQDETHMPDRTLPRHQDTNP
jgi:hypothetical protein